jgi:hypothetical protein
MKVVCSNDTLDLSVINKYNSCGEYICCQFDVATYKPETIDKRQAGTYIITSDNGVILFEDIAFKMIFDFAMKAQLENMKYIKREMLKNYVSQEVNVLKPINNTNFGTIINNNMRPKFKIEHVSIINPEDIVSHNIKILSEYDMLDDWYKKYRMYDPVYRDAYMDIIQFINDYIYIDKKSHDFIGFVKVLYTLLCTMSNDEFKVFVETFYQLLDKLPDKIYADVIEVVEEKKIVKEQIVKDESEDKVVSQTTTIINIPKSVRRLQGSDITGKDATYTAGYCDSFYDNEIKNVDSDGFLEKLIISRVNEKAAPIDLLSEAIEKEHSKNTPANTLRRNIAELRENADEIINE